APAGGKGRFRRTWRKIRAVLPRRQGRRLARGAHGSPGARGGRCPPPADAAFRLRAGGILMGSIIWLASYPKSGNTWLRAFLHNLLRDAKAPVHPDRFADFCLGESKPEWYLRYLDKPLSQATEQEIMKIRP